MLSYFSDVKIFSIGIVCLLAAQTFAAEKLVGVINNRTISAYRLADLEAAKKEAKAQNKPLMVIASKPTYLTSPSGKITGTGSGNATCHALAAFDGRTVLVFIDAFAENHQGPAIIDQALHTPNPHYTPPTVVFVDPDVTRVLKVLTFEQNFETRKENFKNTILELPKLLEAPKEPGK